MIHGDSDVHMDCQTRRQRNRISTRGHPPRARMTDQTAESGQQLRKWNSIRHQLRRSSVSSALGCGVVIGGNRPGGTLPCGAVLAGPQGMQAQGHQGVGPQLSRSALVTGGTCGGGHGVQGRIHQEGIGPGHQQAHLTHPRTGLARSGHMTPERVAPCPTTHAIGVQGRQRPVHVPTQLSRRTMRGPAQHPGLHRLRHTGRLLGEPPHQ